MEPRAARRLRRRERLGGDQKDQPSREGEPRSGSAAGGNTETHRGPDLVQWTRHMQAVKAQLLEQAQGQLTELLDRAIREAVQSYPPQDRPVPSIPSDSLSRTREPSLGKRKVFIIRKSLLDELMEVQHFRTIYHMFIAGLCVFIITTLAIDFIDEGRLMLEFDLLIFSFGQLPLALVTWVPMFLSTLLAPYQALRLWVRSQAGVAWTLRVGLGCLLLAAHTAVLGILPVHVAVEYELPPASRCVLVFEQVRFLMKSYSFLRETVPATLRATGIFMLLLIFFAFLHCWLNAFAEMLRFGDRMFYRDWWNSTSFSNYYRTWNVVVHDWLYSYVYQDGLWLLSGRARGAAMLGVFLVSAVVHEYIFCFVLGFFYPVMLMLFLVIGGLLNFMMHDQHTGPAWNVLMWTMLFLGQGIQVSLYCQEWYARRHCPLTQTTFWALMTPRSWSCHI
ncbi:sterol O-acyltransferase 2 isoform X2 [Camelus bactrianus]|uniref:O-acyltransferase n=1 Tax=Camelus bactrianus TaxID=9837 RepID=A0A9W3GIF1_CAMBA|nr:sterol O-acyltransferase 2 isoform X2 [Camelus bactrianus]